MTYFGFLLRFLVIPILILAGLVLWNKRRGREQTAMRSVPVGLAIGAHMLIALVYTTPWDNYLVATRVWWYDPALVSGLVLGWVPIEEYIFFLLQPILVGLWLAFLTQVIAFKPQPLRPALRRWLPAAVGVVWLISLALLFGGARPTTYTALLLAWALPPMMLQLAFGADILWSYRRLLFLSIVLPTLYLVTADALAINFGTWTINPEQSFNIFLAGTLPIEEFFFFLLTNTLLTFGILLLLSAKSHERLAEYRHLWQARISKDERTTVQENV